MLGAIMTIIGASACFIILGFILNFIKELRK